MITIKDQNLKWQHQIDNLGKFQGTQMYFICNCARFTIEERNRILKSFNTVGDLCHSTVEQLSRVNSRLLEVLTLMGCIPKPTKRLSHKAFNQMLCDLNPQPLITKKLWYEHYLRQSFAGHCYEEFLQKSANRIYILSESGLKFLVKLNSWDYQVLYGLWGNVSAKQVISRVPLTDTDRRLLSSLFAVADDHITVPHS